MENYLPYKLLFCITVALVLILLLILFVNSAKRSDYVYKRERQKQIHNRELKHLKSVYKRKIKHLHQHYELLMFFINYKKHQQLFYLDKGKIKKAEIKEIYIRTSSKKSLVKLNVNEVFTTKKSLKKAIKNQ